MKNLFDLNEVVVINNYSLDDLIFRIKSVKADKKLTNQMLAELSGIPLGTLAKILARSETKDPQISSIIKIAKALDVSCDYLIYGFDTAISTQNSMPLSAVELKRRCIMGIANRIKMARKTKNMTQSALAEAVGITSASIANYENGVSTPKIEILFNLMRVLDVDANYIYADDVPAKAVFFTAVELKLVENFRALNEEGQEKASDYLADLVELGRYKKDNQSGLAQKEA